MMKRQVCLILPSPEMVRLGDESDAESLVRVLRCKAAKLPIKYLGLLLGANYKEVRM